MISPAEFELLARTYPLGVQRSGGPGNAFHGTLRELIGDFEIQDKLSAPAYLPATLRNEADGRALKNIFGKTIVCLDVESADCQIVDIARLIECCETSGLACAIHSSWSHRMPGKGHRARVIVVPSHPIEPGAYAPTVDRAVEVLGIPPDWIDPRSRDAARLMIAPACPASMTHEAVGPLFYRGRTLDPAPAVEAPRARTRAPRRPSTKAAPRVSDPGILATAAEIAACHQLDADDRPDDAITDRTSVHLAHLLVEAGLRNPDQIAELMEPWGAALVAKDGSPAPYARNRLRRHAELALRKHQEPPPPPETPQPCPACGSGDRAPASVLARVTGIPRKRIDADLPILGMGRSGRGRPAKLYCRPCARALADPTVEVEARIGARAERLASGTETDHRPAICERPFAAGRRREDVREHLRHRAVEIVRTADRATLFVRAPIGHAKSEAVSAVLDHLRDEAAVDILSVTPLNSIGREQADRWRLVHHVEAERDEDKRFLDRQIAVSLESLWRCKPFTADRRSVLVLDEWRGLFAHLDSPTLDGGLVQALEDLDERIAHADIVIALDADLDQARMDDIARLREGIDVHTIDAVTDFNERGIVIVEDEPRWWSRLVEAIKSGRRVVIPSDSLRLVWRVQALCDSLGASCVSVSAEHPAPDDLREAVARAQVLVHSPSLTSATSLVGPGIDDEFVIMPWYGGHQISTDAAIQMLGRVRAWRSPVAVAFVRAGREALRPKLESFIERERRAITRGLPHVRDAALEPQIDRLALARGEQRAESFRWSLAFREALDDRRYPWGVARAGERLDDPQMADIRCAGEKLRMRAACFADPDEEGSGLERRVAELEALDGWQGLRSHAWAFADHDPYPLVFEDGGPVRRGAANFDHQVARAKLACDLSLYAETRLHPDEFVSKDPFACSDTSRLEFALRGLEAAGLEYGVPAVVHVDKSGRISSSGRRLGHVSFSDAQVRHELRVQARGAHPAATLQDFLAAIGVPSDRQGETLSILCDQKAFESHRSRCFNRQVLARARVSKAANDSSKLDLATQVANVDDAAMSETTPKPPAQRVVVSMAAACRVKTTAPAPKPRRLEVWDGPLLQDAFQVAVS